LIWASTTPVPDGTLSPLRNRADALLYNAIADKVMKDNRIATDDLYNFAMPQLSKIQKPANVHFTTEGSGVLAGQVAASIGSALSKNEPVTILK
jgi:hypothetical protein